MATVTTLPAYPAPGNKTTLTFSLQESGTNYIRVWCTAAPPGSELRKKLDGTSDQRNRVEVHKGDTAEPWRYTFDKGGKYTFKAQEYTLGAATYGGGYQGAPDGYQSETKVGNEYTLSVYIGQRIELPVGTAQDTASLIVWVWNNTIRESTIAEHGEKTPAIQATAPSAKIQTVIESTATITALDALVGVTPSTAIGTISSLVSGYITDWNNHLASAVFHDVADAENVLPVGFSVSPNASTLVEFVNEALRKMRQHFTNDKVDGGSVAGRDTGDYHNVSGKKNDQTNMPIVAGVAGPADAYIGLADLYRCFTAHMASTTVHNSADATNTLPSTTSAKLFELHKTVLDILADTSPTVPDTQSTGAMTLMQQVGGVEKPLE